MASGQRATPEWLNEGLLGAARGEGGDEWLGNMIDSFVRGTDLSDRVTARARSEVHHSRSEVQMCTSEREPGRRLARAHTTANLLSISPIKRRVAERESSPEPHREPTLVDNASAGAEGARAPSSLTPSGSCAVDEFFMQADAERDQPKAQAERQQLEVNPRNADDREGKDDEGEGEYNEGNIGCGYDEGRAGDDEEYEYAEEHGGPSNVKTEGHFYSKYSQLRAAHSQLVSNVVLKMSEDERKMRNLNSRMMRTAEKEHARLMSDRRRCFD